MRKTTILLFCLLTIISAFAKQISEQEAFAKAQQFMQGKQLKTGKRLVKGILHGQAAGATCPLSLGQKTRGLQKM